MRALDREIARLAVPALGALVAEPLYVLADTAVVGRIGTVELAGLSVASSALLTGYAIFIFLAYATTSRVARLLGAGRPDAAAREAVQSLWLAALLGVAAAVALVPLSGPLLGVLGAEGPVRDAAATYLRISLLGVPAQLLVFAGTGYLRGVQDTRTPLAVAVAGAVANLLLELWWVQGLGYGIGASALSTVVAQVGSAAVSTTLVLRTTGRLGTSAAPDLAAIRVLAREGGDLVVRTVALRGALLLATAVATRIGTVEVAAHEIAFALWMLLALALDALAIAGQAVVGLHLGAGRVEDAAAVGRRILQLGSGLGAVLGLVVAALSRVLPPLFSDDPGVVATASGLLLWVAVLQPLSGLVFALDGLLIGAGDLGFLARAMVGALAAFALPASAVAVVGAGIGWLWAAIAVLVLARAVPLSLRWRGRGWTTAASQPAAA